MTHGVTIDDMRAIFEITDAMGIHREQIKVPLAPSGTGSVTRSDGVIRIVVPADRALADWLPELRAALESFGFEHHDDW